MICSAYPQAILRRSALTLGMLCICLLASVGCRQAAYNELYIEQLNQESRLLEDRIFEYDAAYRELELQLDMVERDNDRLRQQLAQPQNSRSNYRPSHSDAHQSIPLQSIESDELEQDFSGPVVKPVPIPDTKANSAEVLPSQSPADKKNDRLNDPFKDDEPKLEPPKTIDSELVPPVIELNSPPSALNDEPDQAHKQARLPRKAQQAGQNSKEDLVRVVPATPTVDNNELPADEEVQTASYAKASDEIVEVDEPNQLDLQLPQDSSDEANYQIHNPLVTEADESSKTTEQEVAPEPIVELSFHPAFTHGIDTDKAPGDDSIRVVIQPKTASGDISETMGVMTIVVVDPNSSVENNPTLPQQLGRWTLTQSTLSSKYEPIGSAKGYYLELGPLKKLPVTNQAVIFVRVEYEDGRKLVNRFPIFLQTNGDEKPVWTPLAD